ncbi:MAG: S8 family serine peptidase [Okeania sp. SIO2C2]|uniref:S8 family peptidase n=1 Tax=Okeania sp. SIO2C2 TaxID=2607787 RepID=UPI0013B61EE9|nr:S8 family serine peptidase [Okeania sp. SIO2C2]NEP86273.1 S8 family serine peptidase [Okeania sp. SIO2C2]
MKQHIKLKLKQAISGVRFPHWPNILNQKATAKTNLHPEIDLIFAKYQIPIWVTQEYSPSGDNWDAAELATGLNRIYRLILQRNQEIIPELIQELSSQSLVEEVQVGTIAQADLPEFLPTQMSVVTDRRSRDTIHLDDAQELFTQGNPEITVAILDTGVDLYHPEFKHTLLPGYDFVNIIDGGSKFVGDYLGYDDDPEDEVGHGTHVAGIIAAKGEGMPMGVVPKCRILPVRVLGAMKRGNKRVGAGLVDNINSGIKWAIDQGANIINMSLGIQHTGGGLPHQEVVDYAQRRGVTIVAASGNDGQEQLYYPGALPYVIAVGAVDELGNMANFSTYGKQVDLVAPGTNIYSTYLNHDYAFSTGTSHASPFVAGAVAMLKSYALEKGGKHLSDSQVKYLLKHTADRIDSRFKHRKAGFGKLNLIDALRLLEYKLLGKGG